MAVRPSANFRVNFFFKWRPKGQCHGRGLLSFAPNVLCNLLVLVLVSEHGILLVLVLRDKVANVLVGLLELHLVHALSLVPVEESLPLVHSAELGGQALEDALESSGVRNECAAVLGVLGRDLNNGSLHVVGDPLDEVVGVGALALLNGLINLLGGHLATEEERGGHVLAIVGVLG